MELVLPIMHCIGFFLKITLCWHRRYAPGWPLYEMFMFRLILVQKVEKHTNLYFHQIENSIYVNEKWKKKKVPL